MKEIIAASDMDGNPSIALLNIQSVFVTIQAIDTPAHNRPKSVMPAFAKHSILYKLLATPAKELSRCHDCHIDP